MAWAGTLAGVRLVIQGKHLEVQNPKAFSTIGLGTAVFQFFQLVFNIEFDVESCGFFFFFNFFISRHRFSALAFDFSGWFVMLREALLSSDTRVVDAVTTVD